jgi:UDP-2,4-diacetamido-2,4,6-trideoxy-beta-L-altropyranose hydrolase
MQHSKIIFRADGSADIGFGHIYRLLSLAQMLYKNFDCIFVSHEAQEFLIKELNEIGVSFVKVESIQYQFPDERKAGDEVAFDMKDILKGEEIIVLDGYWFGKQYQQAVKSKGCTVVYIDDLIEEGAIADIVINHSLGVSISEYKKIAPSTSIYTGSQYSLIQVPEKFRHQQTNKDIYSQLLISMGGADPLNFTCKILNEYPDFICRFKKVIIVAGDSYKHLHQLKTIINDFSNVQLLQAVPKHDLLAIMQASTAAILSSSTIAVEYAHVGGALAVVQTAVNQKYLYKGLIENEVAFPVEKIASASENEIARIQLNQKKIFDGRSDERFVKLFNELSIQSSFSFINAGKEHLHITYQWASDPVVRAYSYNQNPIIFEEHRNWFSKKILQPNCIYLLGLWENEIVGSLRFDIKNSNALISYLVSPKYHGKGIGRVLLAKGLDYLAQHNKNVTSATGHVMLQNIASVKIFERLGFSRTEENSQLIFSKNIYR